MPLENGCEGCFVPVMDEASQELPIGQPTRFLQKRGLAKVLNDLGRPVRRHVRPRQVSPPSTLYLPHGCFLMHVFSARKAIPGRIPPGPLPLAVSRSLQASPPAGALIVPDRANRLSTGGEARAPPAPPWPWSKEQFELDALNKDH